MLLLACSLIGKRGASYQMTRRCKVLPRHSPFRLRNCWEGRSVRASSLLRQLAKGGCAARRLSWVTPGFSQSRRCKTTASAKLHAVTDASGRPISFFITAGQVSDYTGAAALLDELPKAKWLLADRGYDADWYRDALQAKGITPCIPGRKSRKKTIKYDKRRYKRRNRIEIMFGRLKDWRRVATRYDRCPMAFLSAIALAATVIFWL